MQKIDAFAHALPPKYYQAMLDIEPSIPSQYPFVNNACLLDIDAQRAAWDGGARQVVSLANILAEDYVDGETATMLSRAANDELAALVRDNPDMLAAGVAMIPMNDVDHAVRMMYEQVAPSNELIGIQLFTRHLGMSIADEVFRPVIAAAAELDLPIWLHPVFDERKPDNNITFSWEYELSQAMLQLVQAGIFTDFPDIKIIVHHAGAMVPFFAERVAHTLPPEQVADFKKSYVDTAILGNPKALELAIDYYGSDHVLFGTDAPFGILPAGATQEVIAVLEALDIPDDVKENVYLSNLERLTKGKLHAN